MNEITARFSTAIADRYTIERELGQGGMATVYLAQDVKHDRKVALKVLRPELAAVIGAERFLQEIKVTANLQHSHILPLYDSGAAEGFLFYVMPYVEGETLRTKLTKEKQLGVEEAVALTRAIATALEHAHKQGVIHRDIKPENILLRENDPLIADFGIALAVSHAGGNRLTETGLSIGTPHYMSPEQAMGDRELDARSDVYSLAAVLYELLTGDPPYQGSTAQAIVAKVITEKAAPVTALRDTVPGHVSAAIAKALAKLPADRFASAAQFAEALVRPELATYPGTRTVQEPAAARPARAFGAAVVAGLGAVALVAIAAALWGWLRPPAPGQVARFGVAMSDEVPIRTGGAGRSIAMAPDGSRFVYVGADRRLYVRDLDQLESRPLPATIDHTPFFSPDGRWVGFFEQPSMKKVALAGGPPLTITDAAQLRGADWGADGTIVFTPTVTSPVLRISAGGGPVDTVTRLDASKGETSHRWPAFLPGGKAVLYTAYHGGLEDAVIAVADLETGEMRRLVAGLDPHYVDPGYLVYVSATGALLAVPFDVGRLEVTGSPVSLAEGILVKAQVVGEFAISGTGSLLYVTGEGASVGLHIVDSAGAARQLLEHVQDGFAPRFAPDGRRIALRASQEGSSEIWTYDLTQGTLSRLSFEGGTDYPVWSPRGDTVYYTAVVDGERDIRQRAADGSGDAHVTLARPDQQWEIAVAPSGARALVREIAATTGHDLLLVPLRPAGDPRPYLQTPFNERAPAIAPDERWAAYVSNESGRDEVYVRAFPEPSGRWQVSTTGGSEPLWSQDGRTIYYRQADTLFAVTVQTRPTFAVGRRRILFTGGYQANLNHTNYDRNAAGEFVMLGQTASATTALVVVLNWFTELDARMQANR